MTHIANALQELEAAHALGEDPPTDTLDAALWRVRFTLRALYDGPASAEPGDEVDPTPLRDLLADLVHYTLRHDISLDEQLERARDMAYTEQTEWKVRP